MVLNTTDRVHAMCMEVSAHGTGWSCSRVSGNLFKALQVGGEANLYFIP